MKRRITTWCATTALGLAAGAASGWEPPLKTVAPENLPPVIDVNHDGGLIPAATPGRAPIGDGYFAHESTCDCEACQPKYLFAHRAECGGTLLFRPDGRFNTVTKPRLQESSWGYCDQFCERPFGIAVAGHFHRQIVNGLSAQMMLYEYDFAGPQSDRLTARGRYQLTKIAQRALQGLGPVQVAATTENEALDQARRVAVETELKKMGFEGGPHPVVVRRPPQPAFNAYENLSIQRNREGAVSSRGVGGLSGAATSTTNSNTFPSSGS